VTVIPEPQGPFFDITAYGAAPGGAALTNQAANQKRHRRGGRGRGWNSFDSGGDI